MPTPIELMVDRACGVDKSETILVARGEAAGQALLAVLNKAKAWRFAHDASRGYTFAENELAMAVAEAARLAI